jgi:hypothetical protein
MTTTAVAINQPTRELAAVAPGGASLSTWLTPSSFEAAEKIAALMAKCGTLPKHLVGQPSDCFRIVVQAAKWGMDPFAVAEHTALVHGRMCYEGKLVHAVLIAMGVISEPLDFAYNDAKGDDLEITVTGKLRRGGLVKQIKGTVGKWKTSNERWKLDPETMLAYHGARHWARICDPGAMMGVITPDEAEEIRTVQAEVVPDTVLAKGREIADKMLRPTKDVDAAAAEAEAEHQADKKAQAQAQQDPKVAGALLVLDLQKRANEAHATFGKEGIVKIRAFCDRIGVKQIAECPPEKAAEALEIWNAFERELHEGGAPAKGGGK